MNSHENIKQKYCLFHGAITEKLFLRSRKPSAYALLVNSPFCGTSCTLC